MPNTSQTISLEVGQFHLKLCLRFCAYSRENEYIYINLTTELKITTGHISDQAISDGH